MLARFIDLDIAVQLLQGVWITEDQSARIRIEGETVTHEFGGEDTRGHPNFSILSVVRVFRRVGAVS